MKALSTVITKSGFKYRRIARKKQKTKTDSKKIALDKMAQIVDHLGSKKPRKAKSIL